MYVSDREPTLMNKIAVEQAFSKAAKTYDQHAAFQRQVGQLLMNKLPRDLSGLEVLDLGCGTGYFTELLALRGAKVTAFDLSEAMLIECQSRCANLSVNYVKGDAERLPFEAHSFDLIFSSLAMQWCTQLDGLMSSLVRVLKPQGQLVYSTLLDGSLIELQMAWQQVDSHSQHVNQFHLIEKLESAVAQSGAKDAQFNTIEITLWYTSAMALMKDLKGIGATHVSGRSHGLTKPKSLLQVDRAYQRFKTPHGELPATYQVCLGEVTK